VIRGLKSGRSAALGLDVYEEEADLFFEDLSNRDHPRRRLRPAADLPQRADHRPSGLLHRGALTAIAETTIGNITAFERQGSPLHPVTVPR
jgi:D-lactate dehydrogenase